MPPVALTPPARLNPSPLDRVRSYLTGTPAGSYALRRWAGRRRAALRERRDALLQLQREAADGFDGWGGWGGGGWGYPGAYGGRPWSWAGLDRLGPLGATGTTQDRRGGKLLPLYWSEQDLRQYRVLSQHLCETNQFAIGFLGRLVDYHVRKGYGWQVCLRGVRKTPYPTAGGPDGRPGTSDADRLVARAQGLVDRWRDRPGGPGTLQSWPLMAREGFRRLRRDGEVFARLFHQGRGRLPEFRFLEPAQVGDPGGRSDGAFSFGVLTPPDDVARKLAVFVRDFSGSDAAGRWVTLGPDTDPGELAEVYGVHAEPGRVWHLAANVDTTVKRGLPDFFPVGDLLEACTTLLRNMGEVAGIQAAIAWIEKLAGATPEQARAMIEAGRDYGPRPYPPAAAAAVPGDTRLPPGTRIFVDGNREWLPNPAMTGAAAFVQVEQAVLRGCGARWGMPEYFSGDSSNNNFASSMVAGSPFQVAVEGGQIEWGALEKAVALGVLECLRDAGFVTREECEQLDVEVEEPAVVTPDPEKDERVRETRHRNGVLSRRTWQMQVDLDPQHESENFLAEAKEDGERQKLSTPPPEPPPGGDVPGGPGGGPDIGGGNPPAAAPPGQAADPSSAPPPAGGRDAWGDDLAESVTRRVLARLREDAGLADKIVTVHGPHGDYRQHRKVRADDGAGAGRAGAAPGNSGPAGLGRRLSHVLPELAAEFPEAKADPPTWAKVAAKAVRVKDAVKERLVGLTPYILPVAEAILDTPEDFQKFGYKPSVGGTAGQDAAGAGDPIQAQLGISTHLFCSLAAKVTAAGYVYARRKLRGEVRETTGDTPDAAAGWVADLLDGIGEAAGLTGLFADRGAIRAAVREHLGADAPDPVIEEARAWAEEAALVEEAGTAAGKAPGRPFQGPSGRWFVVKDVGGGKLRTVPAKAPAGQAASAGGGGKGGQTPATADPKAKPATGPKPPAAPKADPKAAKAAKAAALDAVKAHLARPAGEHTADTLADLNAHLGKLTIPELQALQKEHGAAGGKVKADRVAKLLDMVKGLAGAGPSARQPEVGTPPAPPPVAAAAPEQQPPEPPSAAAGPADRLADELTTRPAVLIHDLRAIAPGVDKETFDRALLKLADDRKVQLNADADPRRFTAADRAGMLTDPDSGDVYTTVSKLRGLTADDVRAAVAAVAGDAGASDRAAEPAPAEPEPAPAGGGGGPPPVARDPLAEKVRAYYGGRHNLPHLPTASPASVARDAKKLGTTPAALRDAVARVHADRSDGTWEAGRVPTTPAEKVRAGVMPFGPPAARLTDAQRAAAKDRIAAAGERDVPVGAIRATQPGLNFDVVRGIAAGRDEAFTAGPPEFVKYNGEYHVFDGHHRAAAAVARGAATVRGRVVDLDGPPAPAARIKAARPAPGAPP